MAQGILVPYIMSRSGLVPNGDAFVVFRFPLQIAVIYTLTILGLVKLLAFLKAYIIFLEEMACFCKYFCTFVPLK